MNSLAEFVALLVGILVFIFYSVSAHLDRKLAEKKIPQKNSLTFYLIRQTIISIIAYRFILTPKHYITWKAMNKNEEKVVRLIRIFYYLSIVSLSLFLGLILYIALLY